MPKRKTKKKEQSANCTLEPQVLFSPGSQSIWWTLISHNLASPLNGNKSVLLSSFYNMEKPRPFQERWDCHCFQFCTSRGIKGKRGSFRSQALHTPQTEMTCRAHFSYEFPIQGVSFNGQYAFSTGSETHGQLTAHVLRILQTEMERKYIYLTFIFLKTTKEFWLCDLNLCPHTWTYCWGHRHGKGDWPGLDHMGHPSWPKRIENTTPKEKVSQDITSRRIVFLQEIFYFSKKK